MTEHILPVATPLITTYPMHTAQMAIASTLAGAEDWLYNYNIMLMIKKDIVYDCSRFTMLEMFPCSCPLLNRLSIPTFFTGQTEDPVWLFKHYIDNKQYIVADIDQYFLSDSDEYHKAHDWQPILIYGYNDNSACFKIAGFMHDLKYTFCEAPYESVIAGFNNAKQIMKRKKMPSNSFVDLINIREHYSFDFCIKTMFEMLTDYLNSETPKNYLFQQVMDIEDAKNFTFGWKVQETLVTYLKAAQHTGTRCDLRPMHILHEHKLLMRNRIAFLYKKGCIGESAYNTLSGLVKEMLDVSSLISKFSIKYNITGESILIIRIIELLNKCMEMDKVITHELLDAIEKEIP